MEVFEEILRLGDFIFFILRIFFLQFKKGSYSEEMFWSKISGMRLKF